MTTPIQPSLEMYNAIMPVIWTAVKLLVSVIGAVGGALVGVLVWVGKSFVKGQKTTDGKVDQILLTIMHCEGCKKAVDAVSPGGRRLYDPEDRLS